jgi:HAD superfamily hydrolase (TIGR01549 family)
VASEQSSGFAEGTGHSRGVGVVQAVVFDIGETLVDESRSWGIWVDWLGVPRATFFTLLGVAIERGEEPRRVFEWCQPLCDLDRARQLLRTAATHLAFEPSDLYPDALPCLESLTEAGYRVGVAGNQPRQTEERMREWGLPVDFIASSEGWGVAKPDPKFFARVAEATGSPPGEIAYVGDRLDNDVSPAQAAGMVAVFLRRGPWGFAHATKPEASRADIRIDTLDELLPALREYNPDSSGG